MIPLHVCFSFSWKSSIQNAVSSSDLSARYLPETLTLNNQQNFSNNRPMGCASASVLKASMVAFLTLDEGYPVVAVLNVLVPGLIVPAEAFRGRSVDA